MKELNLKVIKKEGIYDIPALLISKAIGSSKSSVFLHYEDKIGNMKSILNILYMAIPVDSNIKITIDGIDEDKTSKALLQVLKKHKIAELIQNT